MSYLSLQSTVRQNVGKAELGKDIHSMHKYLEGQGVKAQISIQGKTTFSKHKYSNKYLDASSLHKFNQDGAWKKRLQ